MEALLIERESHSGTRDALKTSVIAPKNEIGRLVLSIVSHSTAPEHVTAIDCVAVAQTQSDEISDSIASVSWQGREYFILCLVQSIHNGSWDDRTIQQLVLKLVRKFGRWIVFTVVLCALQDLDQCKDGSLTLTICLKVVQILILDGGDASIWAQSAKSNDALPDAGSCLTQIVVATPNSIAQGCQSQQRGIPSIYTIGRFHARLVETSVVGNSAELSLELIRLLLRRSGGDPVAVGLFECYKKNEDIHIRKKVASFIEKLHLSDREAGTFVRAILRHHVAHQTPLEWLGLSCNFWIASCWEAVCELVVLSSSSVLIRHNGTPDVNLPCVFGTILRSIEPLSESDDDEVEYGELNQIPPNEQILWKAINLVSAQWASAMFVRRTDSHLQHHATQFLLHGMERLSSLCVSTSLSARIIPGVSERLKSPTKSIRLDGMRVGVLLATLQGQELCFDELKEEEVTDQDEKMQYTAASDDDLSSDMVEVTRLSYNTDTVPDSHFERYELDDDAEDLLNVPKPLYLSECLDLLRTADNDEHAGLKQETALLHISDLVRSKPADLSDHAPELARALLRAENKSNYARFRELTRTSLCALVVEDPLAVGIYLVGEIFEDGTLDDRLTVLCALHDGAMELSGTSELIERRENRTLPQQDQTRKFIGRPSFLRNFNHVDHRLRDKSELSKNTVRWGKARERLGDRSLRNNFRDVGPIWFYALTKRFMETREKENLWGHDTGASLLSSFLETLNSVVYCAGAFAPGIDVIAKDLYELAWMFRNAEAPDVRQSTLRSFGTIVGFLEEDEALSLVLGDSPRSLSMHLRSVAQEDADTECRSLAHTMIMDISKTTDSKPLMSVVRAQR